MGVGSVTVVEVYCQRMKVLDGECRSGWVSGCW